MNIVDIYKSCNGRGLYIDKTCFVQLYTDTKLKIDDYRIEEIVIDNKIREEIDNAYSISNPHNETYLYNIRIPLQYKEDLETEIIDCLGLNKNDLTIINLNFLSPKPPKLFSKDWWKNILDK